ncbi:hypothetical protein N0V83_007298 [Neocucurbitaria cava]|uniref:Uncharacterized protein n=1 Tax=Neocucurbitaria cava TaxID=798079 RepID=A0A9W9CK97_9PLEO|nr:hypothetical protein N0V83_007298 [Neocucurbitaria cava]
MTTAAANLAQLRAKLGAQANLLQFAPLENLKIQELQDPDAISFALLLGYIRDKGKGGNQKVWISLYPSTRSNGPAQVMFHSHGRDCLLKHDSDTIARTVTEFATAFEPPTGRWSKGKLTALAKYCFLEKLVERQTDQEKMKFGIPISQTFVSDLQTVCREFEEEARQLDLSLQRGSGAKSDSDQDSQDRGLSDAPSTLSAEVIESPPETVTATNGQTVVTGSAVGLPVQGIGADNDSNAGHFELSNVILECMDEEEVAKTEVVSIKAQIAALKANLVEAKDKLQEIKVRKERLFGGLTAVAAFRLGMDVERMREEKRQRLS